MAAGMVYFFVTKVSGLRRGFILQLCFLRLCCNLKKIRRILAEFQPQFYPENEGEKYKAEG